MVRGDGIPGLHFGTEGGTVRGCDRAAVRLFLSTAFVETEAVLTLPTYVLVH